MPTANERRALWFLAIVALSGTVVRLVRARSAGPAAGSADALLERQLGRVDSARQHRTEIKKRSPGRDRSRADSLQPERRAQHPDLVDLDRASAKAIEALPGVGPSLAARIVAHRDSAGIFGSLRALCAVRGVGPALATRLQPFVVFSGSPVETGGCEDPTPRPSKTHVTNRRKPR